MRHLLTQGSRPGLLSAAPPGLVVIGIVSLTLALTPALSAGDWPQFRGPNANGVSDEKNLPTEWSKDKGVKWKAALPGRRCPPPGTGSRRRGRHTDAA